uniref:Uncharacterized protein n=1 Tax=Glossina austeni TaxID=7395 RepID=A0A1A9UYM7_GLOAU
MFCTKPFSHTNDNNCTGKTARLLQNIIKEEVYINEMSSGGVDCTITSSSSNRSSSTGSSSSGFRLYRYVRICEEEFNKHIYLRSYDYWLIMHLKEAQNHQLTGDSTTTPPPAPSPSPTPSAPSNVSMDFQSAMETFAEAWVAANAGQQDYSGT